MAREAASYTASFLLTHSTLYGSRIVDHDGSGTGEQYHMTDFIRRLPLENTLYIQVSAVWSGVVYEDANLNDTLIDFTVDFWVNLGASPNEKFWFTPYLQPAGTGLFYKGADPLMDPWWWQDPALGNPAGSITGLISEPQMTVEPERIDGSGLCHAQINVGLQHVSLD